MICENDNLVIPEKFLKMSVFELEEEREQLFEEYKKSPEYRIHKKGGKRGLSILRF